MGIHGCQLLWSLHEVLKPINWQGREASRFDDWLRPDSADSADSSAQIAAGLWQRRRQESRVKDKE